MGSNLYEKSSKTSFTSIAKARYNTFEMKLYFEIRESSEKNLGLH